MNIQHRTDCPCRGSRICDYTCSSCTCVRRDTKAANPKDAIGSTKLPLHLVPASLVALASLAFLEGALKYGTANWLGSGVRASIYISAALRHIWKFWTGEECDPKTRVPHLASAVACLGIIHDARLAGKLNDDRPPSTPIGSWIDEASNIVQHLKELFKNESPKHYTIADTQPQETK